MRRIRRLLVLLTAAALATPLAAGVAPPASAGMTGNEMTFAVDNDGDQVYDLAVRNLTTGATTILARGADYLDPEFNWAGTKILFSSDRGSAGVYHVWVYDRVARTFRQLTTGAGQDLMPTWSPDGSTVAFTRLTELAGGTAHVALFTVPAAGGTASALPNGDNAWEPTYSPDGRRLAFTDDSGTSSYLGTMSLDGTARVVTDVNGWEPSWSPDGRWIAFSEPVGEDRELIATMSPSGTEVREYSSTLTNEAVTHDDRPSWSTDGRTIYYDHYAQSGGLSGDIWQLSLVTGAASAAFRTGGDEVHASFSGPVARLAAAAVSLTAQTSLPFRVSWAVAGRGDSAVVQWAQRVRTSTGWATTAWRPWVTPATSGAGTFGASGRPVTVTQGTTYLFRVQRSNGTETATSPTSSVVVPIDDRNAAISWSRGWTVGTSAARWLGTMHLTRANNAWLSLRTETTSFTVFGDKGTGGAQLKVYLDGVYKGVVSTYARSTQVRQQLWRSATLAGGTRMHTLKLVAVTTATRPTLVIDAVAVTR
jgi:Tol biopolymer transport system component